MDFLALASQRWWPSTTGDDWAAAVRDRLLPVKPKEEDEEEEGEEEEQGREEGLEGGGGVGP